MRLFSNHFSTKEIHASDIKFKRMLWAIIGCTKGGTNRARIIDILHNKSLNTHQIATMIKLDYKTVRYHIQILQKNHIIQKEDKRYGAKLELDDMMNENIEYFKEIVSEIRKK
jgi:predicted transcriptional regulator